MFGPRIDFPSKYVLSRTNRIPEIRLKPMTLFLGPLLRPAYLLLPMIRLLARVWDLRTSSVCLQNHFRGSNCIRGKTSAKFFVDGSKTIFSHKIEGIWTFESINLSKIMNRILVGNRLIKRWRSGRIPLALETAFGLCGSIHINWSPNIASDICAPFDAFLAFEILAISE
jgi:hypothetical protein